MTYEPFATGEVGLERAIVIGKHSGSHAIRYVFEKRGINLTKEESDAILGMVRIAAENTKKAVSEDELMRLYQKLIAHSRVYGNPV
uniref:Homocitrate synthase n=1 Tax=Candidatus Methanophaga sp. ANME-1 ERB7 TaxID=2759913 RepID=A0A7G9ZBK7_9EURY|nr:homocitrate synthase [Methanosarcinales archaeon ANME-1 ERB7]